jgi:TRAP transporter TAXI family solute receptor
MNITRVLSVGLICLVTAACSQEEIPSVSIATGASGGSYQIAGRAIARAMNQNYELHGFLIDDTTTSGSAANIDAVLNQSAAFGIVQADHQHSAVNGGGNWATSGPQSDLRSVFSLYTEAVTLVAAADAGIDSIAALSGQTVDIGLPDSGTEQHARVALETAGLSLQDIVLHQEALDDRLAMLMHGELDAFFYTVGHPNTNMKFATLSERGARFVPLTNVDGIVSSSPYLTPASIDIRYYPRAANVRDVETVGIRSSLVTHATVPDETVYAVTRTVLESLEVVTEYDPVMSSMTLETLLDGLTAPLHPGALKYYREAGIEIPDALISTD